MIVYGASGYTGRLICEYLREYNVPFVAAGRDKARIAEAMDKVPGIDTIEHDIVEVSHDVEPLSELFDGAKVVLNTVGPFAQMYTTSEIAAQLCLEKPGVDTLDMHQMPPREVTRINTSLNSVHASGPLGRAHCVIHGNSPCTTKRRAACA